MLFISLNFHLCTCTSTDSSVGRAVDCRGVDIHRSLVRIRLGGFFFPNIFQSEGEVLRLRRGLAEAQRRAEEYRQERDAAANGPKAPGHGKEDQKDLLQQNQQLR